MEYLAEILDSTRTSHSSLARNQNEETLTPLTILDILKAMYNEPFNNLTQIKTRGSIQEHNFSRKKKIPKYPQLLNTTVDAYFWTKKTS